MTLLQVEAVRRSRGPQHVLCGLDLAVPAGAVVALLGPSGCGKTTLLRLIAGFEPADSGRIVLDGRVLQDDSHHVPPERRRIGYVPQEGTLFPHLSVAGNVGFGLSRAERRAGRIPEILTLTGLAGLDRRYPNQLSGGQQQRTALARALAPKPALILLDEPFAGLDLTLRRAVCADVVALLQQSGATAILVTHDPQEAFTSADLVGVLQDGRVAQFATPEEIYRRPVSLEVARLTGAAVLLDGIAAAGRADTALGPVTLSPELALHGPVHVMLRPEQITYAAAGTPIELQRTAFRGDHTLATIRAGDVTLDLPLNLPDKDGELHLSIQGPCMAYPR